MTEPRLLTTTEAAKYCGVSFRTVIRWIEKGRLEAFQLPGRGDNRIPVEAFVKFLVANNMPVPDVFAGEENRKILVVEDQPEMASAIKRVLKRAGYEVSVALDGFTAGALVQEIKPAMITLDLKMPGIDGYKVLSYIRSQEDISKTKILVISAEMEEGLDKALRMGADKVLAKPFESDELLSAVDELLT